MRFALASLLGRGVAGTPASPLSPLLLAHVAMDETILALAMAPNRFPRRADYERVSAELGAARELFSARGWLADPASYHQDPPPLTDGIATTHGWAMGLPYQQLHFESGFTPRLAEPGRARWMGYVPNRTAVATVVRHQDGPRPWLVCLHGFAMGYPFMDFVGLQTARLHREFGLNVVLPVLPLHGPRKVTPLGGEQFLGFDLMNCVHGLAQTVWDVRRILSWIHTQEPTAVGLYGVSLGALSAALVAGLAGPLDCVIAGVPLADFPALLHAHSPHHIRMRSMEHEILGGTGEDVLRVVGPLQFTPNVPVDRRYIFAGIGDRLALAEQAAALWRRWEEPRIAWYPGNHVGYLWSGEVARCLGEALTESGFVREVT
jgi:dienelactone hydrolase